MKKLLTLAFFVLFGGALWASSTSTTPANPFQDDLICLDNEFAGMTELEQLVDERNATYSLLASENNSLLANVTSDHQDISPSLLGAGGEMNSVLKLVLFVGCILGLGIGCMFLAIALSE